MSLRREFEELVPDQIKELASRRREEDRLHARSETSKAFSKGVSQVQAGALGARGLARGLFGNEEGAKLDAERAEAIQQRAAEFGPRVQRVEDVKSVGDAFSLARNTIVEQVPVMGSMILGGGVGGAAAKTVAGQAAKTAGRRIGTAAAGTSLMAGEIAPNVINDPEAKGSIQERSAKGAVGAIATGALEAIPAMALMRRLGLGGAASKAISGPLYKRVAVEAGKQATREALTEVAQTVGEKLTHKWVNEHVKVIAPETYSDYLNAAVLGAIGGAAFGSVAGIRRGGEREQRGPRKPDADLVTKVREKLDSLRPRKVDLDAPAGDVPSTFEANLSGVQQSASMEDALLEAGIVPSADTGLFKSSELFNGKRARQISDSLGVNADLANVISLLPDDQITGDVYPRMRAELNAAMRYIQGAPLDAEQTAAMQQYASKLTDVQMAQLSRLRIGVESIYEDGQSDVQEVFEAEQQRGREGQDPIVADAEAETQQGEDSPLQIADAPLLIDIEPSAIQLARSTNLGRVKADKAAHVVATDPNGRKMSFRLNAMLQALRKVDPSYSDKRAGIVGVLTELQKNGYTVDPSSLIAGKTVSENEVVTAQDVRAIAEGFRPAKPPPTPKQTQQPTPDPKEVEAARKGFRQDPKVKLEAEREVQDDPDNREKELDAAEHGDPRLAKQGVVPQPMKLDGPDAPKQGVEFKNATRQLDKAVANASQKLGLKLVKSGVNNRARAAMLAAKAKEREDVETADRLQAAIKRFDQKRATLNRAESRVKLIEAQPELSSEKAKQRVAERQRQYDADVERLAQAVGLKANFTGKEGAARTKAYEALADAARARSKKNLSAAERSAVTAIINTAEDALSGDVITDNKVEVRARKKHEVKRSEEIEPSKSEAPKSDPKPDVKMGKVIDGVLNKMTKDARTQLKGVKVVETDGDPRGKAFYDPATETIHLDKSLKGTFRVETAMHELGHHIMHRMMKGATVQQKDALRADFNAWKASQSGQKSYLGLRLSRAPLFIGQWLQSQKTDVAFDKLSAKRKAEALSADEWFADNVARALARRGDVQGVVARFFAHAAALLKQLYASARGRQYVAAPSVEAYVAGLFNAGPQNTDGAPPPSVGPQTTASEWFGMLDNESRLVLEKAFSQKGLREAIREALAPEAQAKFDQFGGDIDTLINIGTALWMDGTLKLDSEVSGTLRKMTTDVARIWGLPSNEAYAQHILEGLKAGDKKAGINVRKQVLTTPAYEMRNIWLNSIRPVYAKFINNANARIRESANPALRKLAGLIDLRQGETGDAPMEQRRRAMMGKLFNRYGRITKGLSDEQKTEVARALQTQQRPQDETLGKVYDKMISFYRGMYRYLRAAGVSVGKTKNYSPLVIVAEKVRANREKYIALYDKLEYYDQMKEILEGTHIYNEALKEGKALMSPREMAELFYRVASESDIQHLGQTTFGQGDHNPSFRAVNSRISRFILENDAAALAEFQADNLDFIVVGYVNRATRRAEFTRTFGEAKDKKPNRLTELLNEAKEHGATEQEIKFAQDFVDAQMGNFNNKTNFVVRRILEGIDALRGEARVKEKGAFADVDFSKIKGVQSAITAYQNWRLLGLAITASFIDPLGAVTRSGGGLKGARIAFKSYREALKNMQQGDLNKIAHTMGIIDGLSLAEALAHSYGGVTTPGTFSAKANATMFKINGLEWITKFSRLAALASGHRFLVDQVQNPTEHSKRYLHELGLTTADVQVDPKNPDRIKITSKTENALFRFVDEAVVRPRPGQRPMWHNDPNFMLVSQYRGFLYSFYETITRRMMVEAKAGNMGMIALPAMMFIVTQTFGELVREVLRFGPEGDERRKEWGLHDYLWLGTERTGLLGPKVGAFMDANEDANRGSFMGRSLIGPTGQQMTQLFDTVMGNRRAGTTMLDAAPLRTVYKDWVQ